MNKSAQVVSMAEVKKRKMIAQYVAYYGTAYANGTEVKAK